jgi:nucleotide-binding universal stress UspA family protein
MNVLLATDGSPHSQAAVELLRQFPFPSGSTLTLLGVMESPPAFVAEMEQPATFEEWSEQALHETEELLDRQAAELRQSGWTVSVLARQGHAAREIIAAAGELGSNLVAVGSHGRGGVGRFLLGSVSDRVVRHAPCSVLVVRHSREPASRGARLKMLLAFDNSAGANRAVELLQSLPLAGRAEVTLMTVLTVVRAYRMDLVDEASEFWQRQKQEARSALESAVASLRKTLPDVSFELVKDEDVSRAILDKADELGPDVLVMGHTGKSAIDRFLLGSVSQRLVHHAGCSTLVVR